ncbi:GNAT family N-acetyltransferase [Pragia fontium]|uniref:GNAT family N-acetyltransferase n=1 Tax=Pragia fontium TaxID=82985 RepID=UPI0006998AEF|nr:GNAT family N-acetyltransferase [Pragia fontium]
MKKVKLVIYDREFLELSYDWLNNTELRAFTLSPEVTREEQNIFFTSLEKRSDYKIWGIEYNNVKIGACGFKYIKSEQAELWCYIGNSSFWGKGLGRYILNEMFRRSKSLNINEIYLHVSKYNIRAIKLYESCGFLKIKEENDLVLMEKNMVECIFFNEKYELNHGLPVNSSSLFLSQEFIDFQCNIQGKVAERFSLIEKSSKRVIAQLVLSTLDGKVWSSPVTGAFGGLDGVSGIKSEEIELMFDKVCHWLKVMYPVEKIVIKLPPDCYCDNVSQKVANSLFRTGWALDSFDLNYHLNVKDDVSCFRKGIGSSKKNRINKLDRTNAVFECEVLNFEDSYNVIKMNREAQGYPMTMDWSSIEALTVNFPSRVRYFNIVRSGVILASSICLLLNYNYIYVFYWGEHPEYRKESPIEKLAQGIYEFAINNNIDVIDIGTSTENSTPNQGLMSFKESLGCSISSKLTFCKVYYNEKN